MQSDQCPTGTISSNLSQLYIMMQQFETGRGVWKGQSLPFCTANSMSPGTNVFCGDPLMKGTPSKMQAAA